MIGYTHTRKNMHTQFEYILEHAVGRKIIKPGIERVQALTDISRLALCSHSNESRAPIANPPNSAEL